MATYRIPLEPEDMLDMPLPDGVSGFELVDGQPVPVSPASFSHGSLILKLGRLLLNHVEVHGLDAAVSTDAGIVLGLARDPRRMRGPDITYVSGHKLRERDPGLGFARFTPDLAVEIDLRGGRKPGGQQRIQDYLEAGIGLVWAIDPRKRRATVYRQDGSTTELTEHDTLDGESVVPGFRVPLAALFR